MSCRQEELVQGESCFVCASPSMIAKKVIVLPRVYYGSGSGGWVYCYYFDYVRKAYQKAGKRIWPCKIGFSDKEDILERLAPQFDQESIFEAPRVGFCTRNAEPEILERAIHDWYKAKFQRRLRNGEITYTRWLKKKHGDGLGKEWFETNLLEVRLAYREVVWPRWYHWPRRILESWRMALGLGTKFR